MSQISESIKNYFLPIRQDVIDRTHLDDVLLDPLNKQISNEFLTEFKNRELFKKFGLKAAATLLMYGVPGSGKTMLATAIANELKCPMYILDVSKLLKDTNGMAIMSDIFDFVEKKENQPCILFMDECDGIAKSREGKSVEESAKRLTNVILQRLQIINDNVNGDNNNLLILLATNLADQLDDALLSRCVYQMNFLLPDDYRPAIKAFLKKNKHFQLVDDVDDSVAEGICANAKLKDFSYRALQFNIDKACKDLLLNQKLITGETLILPLSRIFIKICNHIQFNMDPEIIINSREKFKQGEQTIQDDLMNQELDSIIIAD